MNTHGPWYTNADLLNYRYIVLNVKVFCLYTDISFHRLSVFVLFWKMLIRWKGAAVRQVVYMNLTLKTVFLWYIPYSRMNHTRLILCFELLQRKRYVYYNYMYIYCYYYYLIENNYFARNYCHLVIKGLFIYFCLR